MSETIFYSWQSDLPNHLNHGFIQEALEVAAAQIRADTDIEVEPVIDRDTLGMPGAPDIASTILKKIEAATVFICDVSFVTPRGASRPSPNPNVLLELGYALKAIGPERIVMVFNAAFGDVSQLPFDLRFKRVLQYRANESDDKAAVQRELVASLESAARAIFQHILDAKESSHFSEFASQLQQALSPVLILADQIRERRIGHWADSMHGLFRGSMLDLRRLATDAAAADLGVSDRLETTAQSLERVLNHSGYGGDAEDYGSKLATVVEQASALKRDLIDNRQLSREAQKEALDHLRTQARRLDALSKRALRVLEEDDAQSSSDVLSEASNVGYILLQLTQYRLDFINTDFVAKLRPHARSLHLLEVRAGSGFGWERTRKRLEEVVSSAKAVRELVP